MEDFFYNLADSSEAFLSTPPAALIGTVFVIAAVALILLLLRSFERR